MLTPPPSPSSLVVLTPPEMAPPEMAPPEVALVVLTPPEMPPEVAATPAWSHTLAGMAGMRMHDRMAGMRARPTPAVLLNDLFVGMAGMGMHDGMGCQDGDG